MALAAARPAAAHTDPRRIDRIPVDLLPDNLSPAARAFVQRAAAGEAALIGTPGQRLFQGACAACHHDGDGPTLLGANRPLALNTNLHANTPDNLIRTILDGVQDPATPHLGFMQGFRDSLDDGQIAAIAGYMRARYAPKQPAWAALEAQVGAMR